MKHAKNIDPRSARGKSQDARVHQIVGGVKLKERELHKTKSPTSSRGENWRMNTPRENWPGNCGLLFIYQ
jgi:hypothetical protein